jgi:hypothetical protein
MSLYALYHHWEVHLNKYNYKLAKKIILLRSIKINLIWPQVSKRQLMSWNLKSIY